MKATIEKRVDLSQIDPEVFQNATTLVETAAEPKKASLFVVEQLSKVSEDGTPVTTLKKITAVRGLPDQIVVDTDIYLNGGEAGGLIFPGVGDVIDLINASREEPLLPPLPFPITGARERVKAIL